MKAKREPDLFDALDRAPTIGQVLGKDAPAQAHSSTSVDAADAIEPARVGLQQAVYAWLRLRGSLGGTDEEGIDALQMSPSTYRPRRVELVEAGLVLDSQQTRPTRSGRKAVVWIVNLKNAA